MKKLIISIFIIFALITCGCIDESSSEESYDESNDAPLMTSNNEKPLYNLEYIESVETVEVIDMGYNTKVYKFYDKDEDVIIYAYNSYNRGGITAIPKNEIEYWKNYEPEV